MNTSISQQSYGRKISRGVVWALANNVTTVLIHLTYAVVFSRLLHPNDFGLWATALAVILLAQNTTMTGFEPALIQKPGNVTSLLNAAWTMEIFRSLFLFCFVFLLAPFVSRFYGNDEIELILRVLSTYFLITGVRNVGTIYFRKELNFFKQFVYEMLPSAASLLIALGFVYVHRTVWALVVGHLSSAVFMCLLSYLMHAHRPRIEYAPEKFRSLFGFGFWVFANSLLVTLRDQAITLFTGKFLGLTLLGFFNRAEAFSSRFYRHIVVATFKIGFPAFAHIHLQKEQLRRAYIRLMHIYPTISMPVAAGLIVLAPNIVKLLLTEQWLAIVPLVQIISLHAIVEAFIIPSSILFPAVGKPEIGTRLGFLSAIVLLASFFPLTSAFGIRGVPLSLLFSTILVSPLICIKGVRLTGCTWKEFFKGPLVALFSTSIMIGLLYLMKWSLSLSGWLEFLLLIFSGIISYLVVIWIIDRLTQDGFLSDVRYFLQSIADQDNDGTANPSDLSS